MLFFALFCFVLFDKFNNITKYISLRSLKKTLNILTIRMNDSGNDSDDTICSGSVGPLYESKTNNVLTTEFFNWDKTRNKKDTISILQKYEMIEETILDKLETMLSYMDNFVAIQAVFPTLERRTKNSKIFKPINFLIKQVAKVYIVMILIYLKRFALRLRKINKLIKVVQTEFAIIQKNFLLKKSKITEYHEKCLRILYMEKIKAIVEIIGYTNDLLLNLSLVTKRFKLGRLSGKFIGFVSWMVNIYRICKDEKQEIENEQVINEMQNRFNI